MRRSSRDRRRFLLLAGPDGSGKSTLAKAVIANIIGDAVVVHMHHRPSVLLRRSGGSAPVTDPHGAPPYGRLLSLAKVLYLFADFVLGWLLRIRPALRRGEWVLLERGWYDLVVDPRRYRLNVHRVVLLALGRLLPRADVAFVLSAPPATLRRRKQELSVEELERQTRAWHTVEPGVRVLFLDASLPVDRLVTDVRAALEGSSLEHDQRSWVNLPTKANARWILPRTTGAAAAFGTNIYQPVTLRGVAGWKAARLLSRAGILAVLPPGAPPPRDVLDQLDSYLGADTEVAVSRSNHANRFVALLFSEGASEAVVCKIALDVEGRQSLVREARAVEWASNSLQRPMEVPRIVGQTEGVLAFKYIDWAPRLMPWRAPTEIWSALGSFYSKTMTSSTSGGCHGDFAPWNLLRTSTGWAAVDWEDARDDEIPLFDVFHYYIQAVALLGRPRLGDVVAGAYGKGDVGSSVRAFCETAGVALSGAPMWLSCYLEKSMADLDPSIADERRGLEVRSRLITLIGT